MGRWIVPLHATGSSCWLARRLQHRPNTHDAYLPDVGLRCTRHTCYPDASCYIPKVHGHLLQSSHSHRGFDETIVRLSQKRRLVGFTNTQPGMLPGISRKRNVRSKFWWFTRSCNSHCVSHFAAFFIVVGTKTSVAESCIHLYNFNVKYCINWPTELYQQYHIHPRFGFSLFVVFGIGRWVSCESHLWIAMWLLSTFCIYIYMFTGDEPDRRQCSHAKQVTLLLLGFWDRRSWCDNDPSAGSPTETLLRLHLPLSDKVQTASHGHS